MCMALNFKLIFQLWHQYDTDGSGSIEADELKVYVVVSHKGWLLLKLFQTIITILICSELSPRPSARGEEEPGGDGGPAHTVHGHNGEGEKKILIITFLFKLHHKNTRPALFFFLKLFQFWESPFTPSFKKFFCLIRS